MTRYESIPKDLIPCAIFIWTVLAVTSVAVGLRGYVRIKITRTFGKDDAILFASHLLNVIAAICWLHVHLDLGNYPPNSPQLLKAMSSLYFVAFICYSLASALIKLAIGLFFLKVVQRTWQKRLVLFSLGAYLISLTASCMIVLFRCGLPILPRRILGSDHCAMNGNIEQSLGTYISGLNSAVDWIFAIMPIYLVHTDQRMNVGSKLAIYFIIGLAITGSIVSLVRLPYYLHANFGSGVFNNRLVIFLSLLESALGALAISLTTLQPLIRIRRLDGASRISVANDNIPEANEAGSIRPLASDWFYSAKVLKAKTRNMTLLSLSRIGVLPDITMSGTVVAPEDRDYTRSQRIPPRSQTLALNSAAARMPSMSAASRMPSIVASTRVPSIGAVLALPVPATDTSRSFAVKSKTPQVWEEEV